ncbi:type II toxin-antitoxin system VapC family toxin [Leifsonia sp. Leaf264]|uniref:type II toxin-antitoxin system VapC family toxin n=1 Tax=Leifsonia sp. Leaf264 TaxID=1736314 RepID=UPI0006FC2E8B|nr:type II toxin-antitoxin system VapC family toxin [Leifsonia sp. Leaf264]KQP02023.1 hypothetical protein ASF30_03295 [Leifsonia sp. Leaf264]
MTRFVIGPDVALVLAAERATIAPDHQLVAPTLLRSQVLTMLFEAVARGELDRAEASRRLDFLRGLRMRLLGDRVLQANAWRIADELGFPDTYTAEYIALTRLQADAFVTLDPRLAEAVRGLVRVAPLDDLR